MGEHGQVVSATEDEVVVRLERTEACAKCRACTAGMSKADMMITAKNICEAEQNDWVNIELEHSNFLLAVTIMYGIPLVGLLTGFFAGFYCAEFLKIPQNALVGFVVGIIFMCGSFAWIRSRESRWKNQKFIPVATERVAGE